MTTTFIDERTGRFRALEMPADLSPWPELEEAAKNAQRLEREFQEAYAAHEAAKDALEQSVADDRAKLAEAKLAGRKQMPKPEGVEAAQAKLDEACRQMDAADDARRLGAQRVLERLEEHRARYVKLGEEAAEEARSNEAAALEAYLETVNASTHARETLAWLEGFPEKRHYRPNPGSVLAGMSAPIPLPEIVQGLKVRAGLADPPPRTLLEQQAAARKAAEEAATAA